MKFIPYGMHYIDEDDIKAVVEVLKSDWIVMGEKVREFEKKVCEYVGAKYGVAVNSGTSALDIAVASLGLPEGSEVITTPFTFVATSNAILYNNLKPVFADIQKDTFNIDPNEIEKKITDKTKAIIYVDYAGQPCEIEEIKKIAEENNLYLIEDACHALGAKYKGKKVGSFADITIFSFHPVKHITTGEGGIAVTNNKEFAEKMRMLRNHGIDLDPKSRKDYKYDMKFLGRNYRMTDFQAALGISQLKKLNYFLKRRKDIAEFYMQELEGVVEIQGVKDYVCHAWHLFPILVEDREFVFKEMRRKGIGANVHYIPVYKHSYYKKNLDYNPKEFTNTEYIYNRELSIPIHPRLTEEEVLFIVTTLKKVVKNESYRN